MVGDIYEQMCEVAKNKDSSSYGRMLLGATLLEAWPPRDSIRPGF